MENKKIGILSMHRIVNYGSFMQALGLKLLLKEIGYEVCFVDYHVGPWYSMANIKKTLIYNQIRNVFRYIMKKKKNPEYVAISSQYSELGLDERYHYRTKVDVLILGSDEVFNYIQTGDNVGYAPELLGIHSRADRVISYAASCGNLTKERLLKYNKVDEFSDAMKKLATVSVRDDNTYLLIRECTDRNPIRHLDPVLVADFKDIMTDNIDDEDYILIYGYTNRFTNEEGNAIRRYAQKCNKKLIALGGTQSFCDATVYCKPLEVFAYFSHAAVIITDTFHGTIFSVVNHKNVAVIVRDGENGNRNKLGCLIKQLGMENKVVQDINELEKVIEAEIPYSEIDEIRKRERTRTLDYLTSCISC